MQEKFIFPKSCTSKSESGCFNDELLQWWAALRLAFPWWMKVLDCQAAAAHDQRWAALVRLETDLEERLRRERWLWLAPSQPGGSQLWGPVRLRCKRVRVEPLAWLSMNINIQWKWTISCIFNFNLNESLILLLSLCGTQIHFSSFFWRALCLSYLEAT